MGSDDGLSPSRRKAIIWNIVGILLVGPIETGFTEILINIDNGSDNGILCHECNFVKKSIWKSRLENAGHFVSAWMC